MKSLETYFNKSLKSTSPFKLWGAKDGFYTTIRIEHFEKSWVPLFWEKHWNRLLVTAKKIETTLPSEEWMFSELSNTIAKSQSIFESNQGGLIRIAVTLEGYAFTSFESKRPTDGLIGIIYEGKRRNPEWKLLEDMVLYQRLLGINRQSQELLLYDSTSSCLLEGATSNLIVTFPDRVLISGQNVLNGITVSIIRELIENKKHSKTVVSGNLQISDLKEAEEIILSGSGKGVSYIKEIPEQGWRLKGIPHFYNWLNHEYLACEHEYCLSKKRVFPTDPLA